MVELTSKMTKGLSDLVFVAVDAVNVEKFDVKISDGSDKIRKMLKDFLNIARVLSPHKYLRFCCCAKP
ncbi:MAG: hypothetical protein QXR76_05675 [Candidatus Bathyarchaeia archaeon]